MVCVDVSGKKFPGKYFQEILRRGSVGDGSGGESWTDLGGGQAEVSGRGGRAGQYRVLADTGR